MMTLPCKTSELPPIELIGWPRGKDGRSDPDGSNDVQS